MTKKKPDWADKRAEAVGFFGVHRETCAAELRRAYKRGVRDAIKAGHLQVEARGKGLV